MSTTRQLSAQEFKEWLDNAFIGNPGDARKHCEQNMSPKYLRFQAGSDRTDFERAVEKVAFFRANCKKWETEVLFFLQDGNKVAARVLCVLAIGDAPEKCLELMFMGELNEQDLFENVWELSADYTESS